MFCNYGKELKYVTVLSENKALSHPWATQVTNISFMLGAGKLETHLTRLHQGSLGDPTVDRQGSPSAACLQYSDTLRDVRKTSAESPVLLVHR